MPNFAVLNGENVINIVAAESKEIAEEIFNTTCIEIGVTDYAEPGGTYVDGVFRLKKPHPSWILNDKNLWEAPVAYPEIDLENPKQYRWNEDILNWEEIQVSE
jgi:hypothetical protein